MKLMGGVTCAASFSTCGTYRYSLTRDWGDATWPSRAPRRVLWVMLNPSTATAEQDDPTVRRCQSFAREWGYDGIYVANLYALRSTDPKALLGHHDPVGPDNDKAIDELLTLPSVKLTVAAWGSNARPDRVKEFIGLAYTRNAQVHALGFNQDGNPKHPLYLKGDTEPQLWLGRL